jgi:hypothetical protein
MMADPMSIAMAQLDLWADQARLWQHATGRLLGLVEGIDPPDRKDRRFQHPAWTEHFVFDYIKQSYEIFAGAILSAVHNVEGLDPKTEHKVRFYARQFVDALAPSNFIATNPEVLQATIETGGPAKGSEESGAGSRTRSGTTHDHDDRPECVSGRREPCHHERQGHIPERADAADPVRAVNR